MAIFFVFNVCVACRVIVGGGGRVVKAIDCKSIGKPSLVRIQPASRIIHVYNQHALFTDLTTVGCFTVN